jgi:peptidoglycan/xylan/chitin deacetylase (PgdA/CDA1 family)
MDVGSELRQMVAGALHYLGPLRLMERLARSHELRLGAGGAWPVWNRVRAPRFAILCYHRIGVGGVPVYSELPAAVFEAQMLFLKKNYRVLSLGAMLRELSEPGDGEPGVVVTFDDGYGDLFREAYPILLTYQVPATVYLTVGAIETGEVAWYDKVFAALQVAPGDKFACVLDGPRQLSLTSKRERLNAAVEIISWMRNLPDSVRQEQCAALEKLIQIPAEHLRQRMLTWEQVRHMHRGGICFGAHTMSHPVVSRLSVPELDRELVESKQILEERIQEPVLDFAYPFGKVGDLSPAAERMLARCKYRSAVTTEQGLNAPGVHPFRLHRVSIGEEHSLAMFAFRLNRLFFQAEYGRALSLPAPALAAPQSVESSAVGELRG